MTSSSEDNQLKLPKWLVKDFFNDIVDSEFRSTENKCEIKDLKVQLATAKGDNFVSVMYRASLEVEQNEKLHTLPVIVKAFPDLELTEEMIRSMNAFPREIEMYTELIPEFEKLFQQNGDNIKFSPKCFKSEKEPTEILVLEDLKERNFKMVNRQVGLNMDHTKLVLEKLAKMHAASAVHFENHGSYKTHFDKGMFSDEKIFEQFFTSNNKILVDIMRTWPFGEKYADILMQWDMSVFQAMMNSQQVDENSFNVLNHGDLWCNNTMFTYDANDCVDDVLLVDFQLGYYGSPAIDLNYFLFSSVSSEIKLSHFDYFIQYYHTHLVEALNLLKYKKHIPTLHELQIDVFQRQFYAVTTSFGTLAICLMDKTSDASMDLLVETNEAGMNFKNKMYNNPRYISAMEELLPYFYNKGLLDVTKTSTPPLAEWMETKFYVDIIENEFQLKEDQFNIKKLHINSATDKGDNFASVLYRVNVEIENKDDKSSQMHPVIVKASPVDSVGGEMIKTLNVFPKEIEMYTKLIPEFERLFSMKGKEVSFGPKCLKSKHEPIEILVLQDLRTRNLKMVKRQEGLDMDHTKLVLEKLSKFHAVSAVYAEQFGQFNELFLSGIYTEKSRDMFESFSEMQSLAISKFMKQWPFGAEYEELLGPSWMVRIFEKILETVKVDTNGFNVLNHGDMWCNNSMYSYDSENKVKDVTLVDFQMCVWGSPAIDLNYFFISSVSTDIKLKNLDYFIRYYHENLISSLELLEFKGKLPTLKQLQLDFVDRGLYGVMTSFGTLPICLMEATDNASIDLILKDDEAGQIFKEKMFNNERYRKAMSEMLPYFHNKGLLVF